MLLSHAKIELYFHLVIVTKYRHKSLNREALELIRDCASVINKAGNYGINVIESNIDQEDPSHVHFILEMKKIQSVNLSKFLTSLKAMSSRKLKVTITDWQGWSASYYLATVSKNGGELEAAKEYVRSQHRHGC